MDTEQLASTERTRPWVSSIRSHVLIGCAVFVTCLSRILDQHPLEESLKNFVKCLNLRCLVWPLRPFHLSSYLSAHPHYSPVRRRRIVIFCGRSRAHAGTASLTSHAVWEPRRPPIGCQASTRFARCAARFAGDNPLSPFVNKVSMFQSSDLGKIVY